jgi:serine/threonine protein kinase
MASGGNGKMPQVLLSSTTDISFEACPGCPALPDKPPPLGPGDRLTGGQGESVYQVIQKLGKGAFGAVYECSKVGAAPMEKTVAVKISKGVQSLQVKEPQAYPVGPPGA